MVVDFWTLFDGEMVDSIIIFSLTLGEVIRGRTRQLCRNKMPLPKSSAGVGRGHAMVSKSLEILQTLKGCLLFLNSSMSCSQVRLVGIASSPPVTVVDLAGKCYKTSRC